MMKTNLYIVSDAPTMRHGVPSDVREITYRSGADGLEDWMLVRQGSLKDAWLVVLHGHGSNGDQIFVREDIRDRWLPEFVRLGLGICSPNLRGNNWMSDAALADLKGIVEWLKASQGAKALHLFSGSMGGFGALVYASTYPADFKSVVALCPPTDLASFHCWQKEHPGEIIDWIRGAIEEAYGGSPDEKPELYAKKSPLRNADRLTMPLFVAHGTADKLVPVEFARLLAERLKDSPGFKYVEIPGGNHDAPLFQAGAVEWLTDRVREFYTHLG